jgi:hypothetical protein
MKTILKYLFIFFILLSSRSLYGQVGIGTVTPENSSILDISSSSKGLLIPRLSTLQRDAIVSPAEGLLIYNTSLSNIEMNIGNITVPNWVGTKEPESIIDSVFEGDVISTISTNNLLVSGMTIVPQIGTFIALFNAQHRIGLLNKPFSSDQGVIDMAAIYEDLMAVTGGIPHALVFGNGETLLPGVYEVTGATSIAGTLILDGGGDPNSIFIIRSTGAFTSGAGTTVILAGSAEARNIFWVSELPLSTGANSIMKGTLVSRAGAISLGATTSLEGRMFTKAGALGVGASSILTVPSGASLIDLGVLSSFAMFTSNGAITDDITSIITGDVGTGLGAITILGSHTGEIYLPGSTSSSKATATYSIYQNGTEVVNSSRTTTSLNTSVSLQSMITILTAGESIEVRWKVENGEAILDNRTLSMIRSGY